MPNKHRPAHTALDIVVDGGWVCASGPNGELLNRKKLVYVKTSGIQIRAKPNPAKVPASMHVFNLNKWLGDDGAPQPQLLASDVRVELMWSSV